ncbi:ABC transporter ATP-binding protein [Gephyromycinifex aptenodytis]|uniref:ABC transporter ATP-binding protein n=1 Tax=Gephyromycinifex aptenodytis TaxID=2716227 RepID=UPI001445A39C|nr:ABC transporter ATP-binding protein [Gephyromycinifex aptenodytis]
MTDTPTPDAAADKRARAKDALKWILAPIRGRILLAQILAGLSGALAVAPYVALVRLGEVLLRAHAENATPDAEQVHTISMWLIGTFLTQLSLYFLALAVTHFADLKLGRVIRERVIDRLAHAPLAWFTDTNSGRVRKAVQDDVKTLHTLVAHAPVESTAAAIIPLALVVYAFTVDWRLGLLSVATLPVYAGIQAFGMRDMGTKTAQMDSHLGNVSATAVEFADGIAVVKAFGRVGEAHRRFSDAARTFSDFYSAWVTPLLRISAFGDATVSVPVLVLINMAGGAALVRAGVVTPADALTTTLIALVVPASILTIGRTAWSYQLAGNAALRVDEVLNGPTLAEPTETATPEGTRIELKDVSFSYGHTRALDGVDLTLEPGSVTALVGPSGSGKSTLATMTARFQDPQSGSILLGGVDLRQLPSEELYRTVSFVLQDPQLPRLSIRENIRLARPDASDEQVMQAAADAQITADIAQLPEGLDTIVGDGSNLSGGQRQRIAIARALLADAPVLVLDEATAATDADCEAEIQEALNRLVKGRTVLVIGHRPESVLGADRVVRLDLGRVTGDLQGEQVTAEAVHALMTATALTPSN